MSSINSAFKKELEYLNQKQKEVVFSNPQNSLVLAGPGSGKTQTIVCRLGFLISSGLFKPYNILLLTFTRKAAEQMSHRIATFGIETNGLIKGTFHHFSNYLLNRYIKYTDLKPNFTILDSDDQKEAIKNIISDLGLKSNKLFPKPTDLIEFFTYAYNCYIELTELVKKYEFKYLEYYLPDILKIKALYENYKTEHNVLDYDDLLYKSLKLLKENKDVRKNLSEKIKYILVDDFQDTSRLQWEILKTLIPSSYIMVVGDDAQSIYGFRGANIGNIIEFKELVPECKIFTLVDNYRSSKEIVDLANQLIKSSKYVHQKELRAQFEGYTKPIIYQAYDPIDEAEFVVNKIKGLLSENNLNLNDIAVLYRKDFLSQSLQLRLINEGIPFEVRSGKKFTELAHIKDMIAFAKIIINPNDSISWNRILTKLPAVGKGHSKEIITLIGQNIKENAAITLASILTQLKTNSVKKSIEKLGDVLRYIYDRNLTKPYDILKYIVDTIYKEILFAEYDNFRKRYDDITGFMSVAKNYDSLQEFISDITITTPISLGYEFDLNKEKKDFLILSTIHQAKGLEWQAVFIIGLIDGELPDYRNIDDSFSLDEELRLFYVAITRAKKYLFLSFPREDSRHTLTEIFKSSRFIEKEYIPEHLYELK